MEYSNELLLSQDGLKELLLDHKSNLQDLADELTVAVGTLKNYLYGQTSLKSNTNKRTILFISKTNGTRHIK